MKDIVQYILEYKYRKVKSFDYKLLKERIEKEINKPKFLGKWSCIPILWTPQIYFIYGRDDCWSAGKPDNEFHDNKNYTEIKLGSSDVMFIEFYVEKKLFKQNIFEGYIEWSFHNKINDDDTNLDEVENFLNKKSNYTVPAEGSWPEQKKIKFESYEELEKILKELETIINRHNTKCDKNEPTYLYFDKSEAEQNSEEKKKQYEILTYEEEIVKLTKQLEDVEKAASASDTDLSTLMDSIKEQIENFKKKKENIKNDK